MAHASVFRRDTILGHLTARIVTVGGHLTELMLPTPAISPETPKCFYQ